MERFQRVTATFQPRRIDDLVPDAIHWIGVRQDWSAAWVIVTGPYTGEWAMTPLGPDRYQMPFAWVPLGDLDDIRVVDRSNPHAP